MIYDAALRRADQAIGGVKPMTERRPVPSMNDVDVAFGTTEFLPAYDTVPDEFKWGCNIYVKAVEGLFFKGGCLSDYGLQVRDDLDATMVHRAIRAHLCSWEPKHEHKTAGVALMLHDWCETIQRPEA